MRKNFMNKSAAVIATVLMAVSLTACNGGNTVSGNVSGQEVSVSSIGKQVDHDTAASTVLMTFEDIDITLEDYYLFMVQYLYNFEIDPATLASPEAVSNANNSILNEIKLETVEYKLALVEEVTPDPVAISDADVKAQSFYDYFGQEFFDSFGISKEKVNELFERQVYIEALRQKTLTDLADDYEAEYIDKYGEMKFFQIYYVLFPSIEYDDDNQPVTTSDGAYVSCNEAKLQEQNKLAEELREKALENVENGEADGNLEELAIEYGVDFVSGTERGYVGAYSKELNELLEGMENGDISEVVETEAGYMVVRMDNTDDTEFKDYSIRYMAEQSASSLYTTVQDNWIKESGIANAPVDTAALTDTKIVAMCEYLTGNGLTINGGNN